MDLSHVSFPILRFSKTISGNILMLSLLCICKSSLPLSLFPTTEYNIFNIFNILMLSLLCICKASLPLSHFPETEHNIFKIFNNFNISNFFNIFNILILSLLCICKSSLPHFPSFPQPSTIFSSRKHSFLKKYFVQYFQSTS